MHADDLTFEAQGAGADVLVEGLFVFTDASEGDDEEEDDDEW
jgi:hypothetical protein